jgi:uncharacterized membrane protein YkvA (DUF1232 family)
MPMFENAKKLAKKFKQEIQFYRLVIKHKETPRISKFLLGAALAYALMPFDLIPDWIPVLGYLDDVIIIPFLVFIARRFIPDEVMKECRQAVEKDTHQPF